MQIQISSILPHPDQPRKHIDQEYIKGLAESIRTEGLKDPITVEDNLDGTYTLVKGQCRILAVKSNGETSIEAIVRPLTNHEGKQRLVDAVIENVSRENMTAVDEGNAYKVMKAKGMSVREISIAVGRTETRIYAMLKIADMEPEIQEWMSVDRLPHSADVVNALIAVPAGQTRVELARKLVERGATIKMVVKACFEYQKIKRELREKKKLKKPALELSEMTNEPPEWDALYQVGKVPKWQLFTEAVMTTCDSCALRPVASEHTCCDCPVVTLCKRMMEKTQ